MELETFEEFNLCFDCANQDTCPKRTNKVEECDEFEEAVYRLTEKGVFVTVVADMGWDKIMGKKADLAWEVFEHRSQINVLDKKVFASVLEDFGWVNPGDNEINIAFDLFCERMERHGYIEERLTDNLGGKENAI